MCLFPKSTNTVLVYHQTSNKRVRSACDATRRNMPQCYSDLASPPPTISVTPHSLPHVHLHFHLHLPFPISGFYSISMTSNTISESTRPNNVYPQDRDELQKVFDRFDANRDGKISSSELADVLKALGSESSPEEISRIMEEIDTDRDGYINLEEFALFCKSDGNVDAGELLDAFQLYDKDKNGLISATELHHVLEKLGERCSVRDCQKMIGSFDSDGDGNISFDEFKEMMTKSKAKKQ